MATSMTGFGQGKVEEYGRELSIEVKTLNHRFLDINIRLPRSLSFIEDEIRSKVQQRIFRGRVEVYIDYTNHEDDELEVNINKPLISAYLSCFKDLELNYNIKNDLSLSNILSIPDLFKINKRDEDEEVVRQMAGKAIQLALQSLINMREKEGVKLKQDILERTGVIRAILSEISEKAPIVIEEYQRKLKERIIDLTQSTELDENRFNMEIALFAERSNITEEIVRLNSHIDQLVEIFQSDDSIGRKLDFLLQEMNREVNTIGSKTGDLVITRFVVDMKSEIEKIREQIQNIE